MEQKTKKNKLSRTIKWMIAFLVLVILIAGVRISLQSDYVFDKVRDFAVNQANDQLNGQLSIDEIRGDLLFGFTVKGVSLLDENSESILTADSIQVAYTLPSLIFSPHHLDQLRIDGAKITAEQYADSTWNFERILPAAEPGIDEPDDDPLFWKLGRLTIENSSVAVISDLLLPDGKVSAENISFNGGAEMLRRGWYANINNFSLILNEERLPEPISFALNGTGTDERITLENVVINSGRSLLSSKIEVEEMDRVEGEADLSPLSYQDLAAYIDDLHLQQDLKINLGLYGSFSKLGIEINASANGLENLTLKTEMDLADTGSLKMVDFSINELNPSLLTGIEDLPALKELRFDGTGTIPFTDYENGEWSGTLTLKEISIEDQIIDEVNSRISLQNGIASLITEVKKQGQQINLNADIIDVFGTKPEWNGNLTAADFNAAVWLNDPAFDSNLPVSASVSGRGFDPGELELVMDIAIEDGRYGDQHFGLMQFTGNVSPQLIAGDFINVLEESRILADFSINNWQGDWPSYEFNAEMRAFNLAELEGLENFPTYINGTLAGSGEGFDPETLSLSASAKLDSSSVNREPIETLEADFLISDSFLFIENAQLESPIADADFSLVQNILDLQHPDNTLSFNAVLKNLSSLAPLFGVDDLGSSGTVTGRLAPNEAGLMEFNGDLKLEDIFVDTLFTSEQLLGTAKAVLSDEPEFEAGVEFINPEFTGYGLQDVKINGSAKLTETEITGDFGFELVNEAESSIVHSGTFVFADEKFTLSTNRLDFINPFRNLALDKPFDIRFADQSLSVDTLRIQTDDADSYLEIWAPEIDSLNQTVGLNTKMLNIGLLQRTILDESFADAFLSGSIYASNTPDSLTFNADGLLEQIKYEGGEIDSVRFNFDLADEWLNANISGWHHDSALFATNVTLPFIPDDPMTFDDQFFDRDVAGEFILYESELPYWFSFLPDNDQLKENTDGKVFFQGFLGGLAGNPEFNGDFKITDAVLSGVPVDSVGIDISYQHDTEKAGFKGAVISRQNRVLDFNSEVPFKIDLRAIEIILPDDDDEVFVELVTNNFNLALFNDFADRELVRQIEGRLNGSVQLAGPIADLRTTGNMELSRGSMRIVPAGITLSEIGSRIDLQPDRMTLEQFTMRSGPGRINASGSVGLQNLTPGDIDFQFRGHQFRAANTTQYNAIVDFDSRLSGTFEEPRLSGSLTFLSGFVNLQNFGERAVEAVELEGEEPVEPIAFYDSLAIEMNVNFGRQFQIRNRQFLEMEIVLGGEVDLVKEKSEELEMFGAVEGVRGFARPLGRNFVIDEAFVIFSGPVDNPELNVRTVYQPPQAQMDVSIFYIIEGTVQDPDFRFDSEPQMELQDIISYTVFGRPFYELESWEQVVAGSGGGPSAADVALDVLLDRVEMLAAQRLGIDVVQIDNSRSGSNSSTSILTGWYLNRRTFFAVLNEVSANPKTLFFLEYLLQDNLELIITQGDDPRQGIDLRWKFDY